MQRSEHWECLFWQADILDAAAGLTAAITTSDASPADAAAEVIDFNTWVEMDR